MLVRVYWNTHRKCWSIVDRRTGRVSDHSSVVGVLDARFHVVESGRQRVLRTMTKNVHAWVVGTLDPDPPGEVPPGWYRVYYNPYRCENFVEFATTHPVHQAAGVFFQADGTVYAERWIPCE